MKKEIGKIKQHIQYVEDAHIEQYDLSDSFPAFIPFYVFEMAEDVCKIEDLIEQVTQKI